MFRVVFIFGVIFSALACSFSVPAQPLQPPSTTKAQGTILPPPNELPFGAVARLGTTTFRHDKRVDALAFTQDSNYLLSAGGPNVQMWQLANAKPIRTYPGQGNYTRAVAVSPDGQTLVTSFGTGNLLFRDLATGKTIFQVEKIGSIDKLVFSRDGKYLAALEHKTVHLLESATGKELHKFSEKKGWYSTASFSPDGKTLALGGYNGVEFWDVQNGQLLPRWEKQKGQGNQIAYTPDGQSFIVLTFGKIQIWDVKQKQIDNYLVSGTPWMHSFALSRSGKMLAAFSAENQIHLYDLATGKKLRICDGKFPYHNELTFSPDGKYVAVGTNHRVCVCDVASGKLLQPPKGHERPVKHLAVSPDGRKIVSASEDGFVIFWDAKTGTEICRFHASHGHPQPITALAYSPDGKMLAAAVDLPTQKTDIFLIDPAKGKEVRRLTTPMRSLAALVFSPESNEILAGGSDKLIRRWDVKNGKELEPFEELPDTKSIHVRSVSYSQDGKLVLVGQSDYQLTILDSATRKVVKTFRPVLVTMSKLVAVPERSLFISGGYDQTVRFVDTATGKVQKTLTTGGNILSLAVSPDGRLLASTGLDRQIRLWEIATGQPIQSFEGQPGYCWSLAFTPDGKHLLSGGEDTSILVWDLATLLTRENLVQKEATPQQLKQWWETLADPDPAKAYAALFRLQNVPKQSVPLLVDFLRPPPKPLTISDWIKQLDSDSFAVREKASKELERLGPLFEPVLHKYLEEQKSTEAQNRLKQILAKIAGKSLQYDRALAILERTNTEPARQLLGEIAEAFPGTPAGNRANRAVKWWKTQGGK